MVSGMLVAEPTGPTVIIAEGEKFVPQDENGWEVTHQDDSYASHTYGGMWVAHGAGLGAPARNTGSVAVQTVEVPTAGEYRIWSKYQAPPYFNYLHRIDVLQDGRTLYSCVYGREKTDRLWSFSASSNVLWWPWGVDHDAAEAPKQMVKLSKGKAGIRLTTVPNPEPAADRFVDFVVLTTSPEDSYVGHKPYRVGTPFANEALAATRLFMRFQNTAGTAAKLEVRRAGHFQPNYGGAKAQYPGTDVKPGEWSRWFNIGPFCRLVHNEGLWLTLGEADEFPVQVARDLEGKDLVGDLKVRNGEAINIPVEITWKKDARVRTSREHAKEVIALTKTWRKANGGKKPEQILFYGAFRGKGDWIMKLKDSLGYNTLLPDEYEHVKCDGLYAHAGNPDRIRKFAESLEDKESFRVLSFGDEIGLGRTKFDEENNARFRAWLKARKLKSQDLGVSPGKAVLTADGDPRLVWYSDLFGKQERFFQFRDLTRQAKELIGPHVLTGANYSPHHLALCYGPIFQWVDIFKHNGMSLYWTEDYIFSVPEAPQIISWMFAQMQCAVKYNRQPIHFYVMPHAPGQLPGFLRRNLLFSIGAGASHIDTFWVAPQENFTENYVAWGQNESFRAIHESIYDTAEAEKFQVGGRLRPARVALITGKATDFNESRLKVDKSQDLFARDSRNAPEKLNQILCRKDQQMLYLALRHAQHAVDLITEDDIIELSVLRKYDVVYFAGEWVNNGILKKLDRWVKKGGILYAAAGLGHLNQFNQPESGMLELLGLKSVKTEKNTVVVRTLLELPLMPPIDALSFDGHTIPAVGMRQSLEPGRAEVLGSWTDGTAAVTVHKYGKGQAFAVGTLAGNTYMKTGVRIQPWPRGGRKSVYNPTGFDPIATELVRLGVDAKEVPREVLCSNPSVEALVMDNPEGTLVTLTNWTNGPVKDLKVTVKVWPKPKSVRSVTLQKEVPSEHARGTLTFEIDLAEADFILLAR